MTVDSTLAFAARRNVPVRYNRDLVATTLKAMQRVSEIRAKRERQFYRNRMRGNRARDLEADRKLVEENQHLLPPDQRKVAQEMIEDMESEEMQDVTQHTIEDESELIDQEIAAEKEAKKTKSKIKSKTKQRLVRGQGVEAMDVDE